MHVLYLKKKIGCNIASKIDKHFPKQLYKTCLLNEKGESIYIILVYILLEKSSLKQELIESFKRTLGDRPTRTTPYRMLLGTSFLTQKSNFIAALRSFPLSL